MCRLPSTRRMPSTNETGSGIGSFLVDGPASTQAEACAAPGRVLLDKVVDESAKLAVL